MHQRLDIIKKMISCTEFIPAYSTMFTYLEEKYGPQEVPAYWEALFVADEFPLYKYIAKEVGLTGSAVIGELCYLQSCFGPDFYHNQEEFVDTLCISMRQFKKTIENLKELGYITVVKKGIPCRNHYTVNEAKIVEVLEK